jgi:hypothetical protein
MLSVKEIHAIQQRKLKRQTESFELILSSCFRQIKKQVEILPQQPFYYFDVPEFILGYPLYKLEDCLGFLINNIKRNGYQVQYIFPRILLISWSAPKLLEYRGDDNVNNVISIGNKSNGNSGTTKGVSINSGNSRVANRKSGSAIKSSKINPKTGKFILNLN